MTNDKEPIKIKEHKAAKKKCCSFDPKTIKLSVIFVTNGLGYFALAKYYESCGLESLVVGLGAGFFSCLSLLLTEKDYANMSGKKV